LFLSVDVIKFLNRLNKDVLLLGTEVRIYLALAFVSHQEVERNYLSASFAYDV